MLLYIFIGLFLIFGFIETLANIFYLSNQNGIALARKQHCELPLSVSDGRMKTKMITMLFIGLLFLGTGFYALLVPASASLPMLAVLLIFTVYMLAEAAYYKQSIGFVFGILGAIMLVVCYLFV